MKKAVWIAAFASFLMFLFAGYYMAIRIGEKSNMNSAGNSQRTVLAKQVICDNTKLICRYFYTLDRVTKERIVTAPTYLHGLNMEQLESICNEWDIVRFSAERVVLRTVIEGSSTEAYILGELGGYLAVYYNDVEKGIILKEKTQIPVYVLPDEEKERIRQGIHINGDEKLAKLLSDYNS